MFLKSLILVTSLFGMLFSLNIELSVKECAGVGASGYPITTVVPLARGAYQDLSKFRLTDASGTTVPAQIEILNRRWAGDNSIANLQVTYMPIVSSFTGSGTGISKYYLKDDGAVVNSGAAVLLTETTNDITVVTGPLKFIVKKNGFNILDQVWYDKNGDRSYTADELVVKSNSHNGGQLIARLMGDTTFKQLGPNQFDADRSDVTFAIEKRGPVEAVIRAEAVTKYYGPSDHTHGWAVRIYAYAGKPMIKVDYQLQNSAKTKKYGWPLYFHAMNLNFDLNLGNNVTVRSGLGNGTVYSSNRGNGRLLAQRKDSLFNVYEVDGSGDTSTVVATGDRPEGFLDMDDGNIGVTAITRNFWRMWPNGIKVDANNMLSVQLFPVWAASVNAATKNPVFNRTHLYWLQDMQHVYKELVLNFHATGVSDGELVALAKTVNYHPVATLALEDIRKAGASVNMEGFIPPMNKISTTDERIPAELGATDLGWNYYDQHGRRFGTSEVGGTPFGGAQFWARENPADWFRSERDVIGEMNTRPEWMAQYNHARDFPNLQLGTNMGGEAYARFDPHSLRAEEMGGDMFDTSMLSGTANGNYTYDYTSSIDDAHMWRYHIADGYWITGNPWLRDFYKFQAEYRKNWLDSVRLIGHRLDFSRDIAHPWAEAFQAYKVTGDVSLVKMMLSAVKINLRPSKAQYGSYTPGWQVGFYMRPLIDLLGEVRDSDPQGWAEVFQAVAGAIDFNMTYGNFNYDGLPPVIGVSYPGAFTLLDPQAWYYWHTGRPEVRTHLNTYIDWGIGDDGAPPMSMDGITSPWRGDYSGTWVQLIRNQSKRDSIPPAAIPDLKLSRTGNQCTLEWTAPVDAKKYHVVWSNRLISPVSTPDMSRYCNWWAANVIGSSTAPTPGAKEHLTFTVPDTGYPMLFAAVFTWDSSWNMSAISNVAHQDTSLATRPENFIGSVLDANTIRLSWGASSDPESGVWFYQLYRNGIQIAESDSPKYLDENLDAATSYAYEVAAVSGTGLEGLRAAVTVSTFADTAKPFVQKAISVSYQPVVFLYFSEAMEKAGVEDASNYAINGGKSVQSVQLLPDLRSVWVTCNALDFGQTYQLTLNNLRDLAGSPNSIAANSTVAFLHKEPLLLDSVTNAYRPNVGAFRFDTCRIGKTPFVDWSIPIVSIPEKYSDLPMLLTACHNNAITAAMDPYITFRTNKNVRLYVVLDDRQSKPSWLTTGFTNTNDDILLHNLSNPVPFSASVYVSKNPFPVGTVGIKGLAGDVNYANYFFLVEPLDSSWFILPGQQVPEKPSERIIWNFDSTTEGWVPNDCPVPKVENGVMKVCGWWAMMYSPESLNINAAKYDYIKLVMRNRSTDSVAKLFFSRTNDFPYGTPTMTFKMVPSDSIFRTYILDMRPARLGYDWVGTLKRIGLQLITHTSTTNNDSVDMDRIELIPDTTPVVAIEKPKDAIVEYSDLLSVYPNPFNPRVNVVVQCRIAGLKASLPFAAIYNIQGRLVARLTPSVIRTAGRTARFEYVWDGGNFASGAYLALVSAGTRTYKKMTLLLK